MKSKHILVTGGAGYIGSHMVRMLQEEGYQPIVFDNLCTGHREFVPRSIPFIKGDLQKPGDIRKVFSKHPIDAVIHFAASVVVPESVADPIKYYENNTVASLNLMKVMVEKKVKKLIVSSTAAIFGDVNEKAVAEDAPTVPTNPYGRSKLLEEIMLKDVAAAHDLRYISLRYFNVAGSHPKGDLGIRYKKITHLVPSILKVANGKRKELSVFGDDYPTKDGTCVRDFIYVGDLCAAHLLALEALDKGMPSTQFNLGNGNGFTVQEVVDVARSVTGKTVTVKMVDRRPGDPAKVVASSKKAQEVLGWKPVASLEDIVRTAWVWELNEGKRKRKS